MESRGWVDGSCLIRCGPDDRDGFLHHAQTNARLIAAAPEMAELLAELEDPDPDGDFNPYWLGAFQARVNDLLSRIRGDT
jgi:hypothetical protein